MTLGEMIKDIKILELKADLSEEVSDIAFDSREVKPGCLFVCLDGSETDGHNFIDDAIKNGAKILIIQKKVDTRACGFVFVENTREALAIISRNFFKNPASRLKVIGITGTKGKTTTSCMIKSILESNGEKTGLIGTLGLVIGEDVTSLKNTTPESYEVQKCLKKMVDSGCKYAVLEASSIGLRDHRLDGFEFDCGVFTNFSNDHIGGNEHKSMQEYLQCKSMLFKKCKIGFINIDDESAEKVVEEGTCKVETFGFSEKSNFKAREPRLLRKDGYLGCSFLVCGKVNFSANIPTPGKFNIYNALAAICVCNYLGVEEEIIKKGLDLVKVKGRVEPIKVPGGYTLLIDYAHNALSMENLLKTLKEYKPNRLITMFGAGGNRPKIRRYEMGEVSGKLSDLSVVTADNSRYENIKDIVKDIKIGLDKVKGKYIVIEDRKQAIKYCIENAEPGDIIILAGKGHETYQEISGVRYPFDERVVIKEIIATKVQ